MKSTYHVYDRGKETKVKGDVRPIKHPSGSWLIIKVRGGRSKAFNAFNKKQGLKRLKVLNKEEQIYFALFPQKTLAQLAKIARKYHDSGLASFAEPYVEYHIASSTPFTDPMFRDQWIMENTGQFGGTAGEDIGIVEALDAIKNSSIQPDRNICLAVLDEGVDTSHPEFANTLWSGNFSVLGSSNSPRPMLGDHHGTAVTGLIAATQNNGVGLAGINPYCKIMAGRIYYSGDGGYANPVKIDRGIRRAIDGGARVINMSFKIPASPLITAAIQYGFNKNVVFCASAGNFEKEPDSAVKFPGNLDEVICVGAIDNKSEWIGLNNSPFVPKTGSCCGREVDIAAPGAHLVTTQNGGGYTDSFGGTSGACAIVSAVAALLLAIKPSLTNIEVRNILLSTADQLPFDAEHVGHGKLNVLRAVNKVMSAL